MPNVNGAYEWDESVDNPSEGGAFALLEPGVYDFMIAKWERAKHNGSANLPPCNKAVVYVQINDNDTGARVEIKNNLFLHRKCDGLSSQFFKACGLRRSGDPLDWSKLNEVVGCTGHVEIGVREGTGQYAGKQYNEIKRFLDPAAQQKSVTSEVTHSEEPATEEIPF